MVNFKIWRDTRDITSEKDFAATGYDRASMRRCWEFLDMTSRSFAMVIKELEGDLARIVSSPLSQVSLVSKTNSGRSASSTWCSGH